jgi:hypothetical protein
VKLLETALVVGALGALGYYVWRRAQPTSVPVGELPSPAARVSGELLGRVAWIAGDPLGWLRAPAGDEEEIG